MQRKYDNGHKDIVKHNISTKTNTIMIGSLAQFEKSFGFLWGHGKEYNDLNDEEKKWRKIWNKTRTNILDNGNDRKSEILDILNGYEFNKLNKYKYNYNFKIGEYNG